MPEEGCGAGGGEGRMDVVGTNCCFCIKYSLYWHNFGRADGSIMVRGNGIRLQEHSNASKSSLFL